MGGHVRRCDERTEQELLRASTRGFTVHDWLRGEGTSRA
ncbi:hypothetical protein DB32_007023 [Sandaracinus amylolyticus]|uniref:Uncharacterized protein n=1 Tax=Sandaracinus amylolyticus TaxID=927083 RepID=A0A0F6SH59_9BACT|nr:hypothetical protein DB32_007023 [Sandaracinus amylolyticus]